MREDSVHLSMNTDANLYYVQLLVKRFDGRFAGNPHSFVNAYGEQRNHVSITFEDGENYKKFSRNMRIIEQPYF